MIESNSSEPKTVSTVSSRMTEAKAENNEEIKISDECYLIIGFEVNALTSNTVGDIVYPSAFVNNTQNLDIDYGHAYFITVRNGIVVTFFSFGPDDNPGDYEEDENSEQSLVPYAKYERKLIVDDDTEELKTEDLEYARRRTATTEYTITAISQVFKFKITNKQINKIKQRADKFKQRVDDKKEYYTAIMNDTCAETAKDILDEAGINTPNGKGHIIASRQTNNKFIDKFTTTFTFVNPYSWYSQFKSLYGDPGIYSKGPLTKVLRTDYGAVAGSILADGWILKTGDDVPEYFSKMNYHAELTKPKISLESIFH